MRSPGSAANRHWGILLVVVLCLPALLLAGWLIWHGIYIGFFAPPETLQFYQFGSESVGWSYRSPQSYFVFALIKAGLLLVAAGLLARWLLR